MKQFATALLMLCVAVSTYFYLQAQETLPPVQPPATVDPIAVDPGPVSQPDGVNRIQVALLLDTSGSMDGLIEQAKTQLWEIINELGQVNKNGQAPVIEVALYEYGKSGLPMSQGFQRQISQFTTDLDGLSEELFALRTNGGQEYCGWTIKAALDELVWSTNNDDLKMIFIAGNESFSQGPVDYRQVCSEARQRGIRVNTIFCGANNSGDRVGWSDGAAKGKGTFAFIDHNQKVAQVATPYDQTIAELGNDLNSTYVCYGQEGRVMLGRQKKVDKFSKSSGVAVTRSITKASKNYRNDKWDLVDAAKYNRVKIGKMKTEELPAEMQSLEADEREEYVNKKAAKRTRIQAKIQKLEKERASYIQQAGAPAKKSLNTSIVKTVRSQAKEQGYQFK